MSAWILLRGWGREARHWEALPSLLQAASPGTQVVALDLPGNGRRQAERSPRSIAAMTERCRAALDAPGPFSLLGLSMGGMVALDWTARFAGEIERCVVMNTSAAGLSAWHRRLRLRSCAALARIALERDPVRRERRILALTTRTPVADDVVLRWAGFARERPPTGGNLLRQLDAARGFRAPPMLAKPLLVLASAGDRLVDSACAQNLARLYGARCAVHPWAGHDLGFDDAAWVVEQCARLARETA